MAAVPGALDLLNQVLPAGLQAHPLDAGRASALADLQSQLMPNPWSSQQFIDSVNAGHPGWVLLRGGQVIAVAVFGLALDELELLTIAVSADEQGRGLAGMLLTSCIGSDELSSASRCTLEVMENNTTAISLYRRYGFVQVGRRKDYYRLPRGAVDALVMQLSMKGAA